MCGIRTFFELIKDGWYNLMKVEKLLCPLSSVFELSLSVQVGVDKGFAYLVYGPAILWQLRKQPSVDASSGFATLLLASLGFFSW